MKYKFLQIFCLLLLVAFKGNSKGVESCSAMRRSGPGIANRTTVADPAENDYDMKYVKFNLNFTDTSIYVSGDVSTRAQVTAANMSVYAFELDSAITIDSVLINGQIATVQTNGAVRKATPATPLNQNDLFTAQVFYHGQPPTGVGFFTGITHAVSGSGANMVYTVSDPYAGKDWWPCKQSLTDKIDSADIWLTVPAGLKAGSNGLLQAVTSPVPGYERYQWKTRYAIDYYLLSVAVAPYFDYSYYMHFSGSTDSMLIQNYLYDSATFMPAYKSHFDSVGYMVDYLSQLYGRYPFDKEKYGHCFSTLSGGMEHQTMTTIGVTTTPLIAHELGHQWFGDHVTYTPWANVWLSEGFATYTEQLYIEHFWSEAAMISYRTVQFNSITGKPGGSVLVHDTTNVDSLFDQRLVYYKGAAVVHMLRYIAQDDSTFFRTLKLYQQQYGFGNATTEDLKVIAEQQYGRNLDTFFNEWVYGQGYPTYALKWNQAGDQKYLQLTQAVSAPSSVPVFSMPLKIQLRSAIGDTTIMVYNNQLLQEYSLSWQDSITSIVIDPNNDVVNKTGQIKYDPTVGVRELYKTQIQVYPNPSKDYWQIDHLPKGADLILTDITGHRVWRSSNVSASEIVPGRQLPKGNYLLNVMCGKDSIVVKLTHW